MVIAIQPTRTIAAISSAVARLVSISGVERRHRQRDEQRRDHQRGLAEAPGAGEDAGEIGMPAPDDPLDQSCDDGVKQQGDDRGEREDQRADHGVRRPIQDVAQARQGCLNDFDHAGEFRLHPLMDVHRPGFACVSGALDIPQA